MKTAKVDSRHRILIPDLKPGQMFTWQSGEKGVIVLVEIRPATKNPTAARLTNVDPLPKKVADRLYRERPANDGIEEVDHMMAAQAWDGDE